MQKRNPKMAKKEINIDVATHSLVPKHEKLSKEDKAKLFERYKIIGFNLPKIKSNDPALRELDVKAEDVIKISRKSFTAGTSVYYRVVV